MDKKANTLYGKEMNDKYDISCNRIHSLTAEVFIWQEI
jgi:hypothetical protein